MRTRRQTRSIAAAQQAATEENGNGDSFSYSSSSSSSSSSIDHHWIWSPNPERRRGEQFFLAWSLIWIPIMIIIVATRAFEAFTPNHYLAVGLLFVLFPVLFPLCFPHHFYIFHSTKPSPLLQPADASSSLPDLIAALSRSYVCKANLYIFMLAWVANYFWTHYFYQVLHATYTFNAHRLNNVPFALYLITHSYFHTYHVLACMLMRAIKRYDPFAPVSTTSVTAPAATTSSSLLSLAFAAIIVFVASYIVAFLEAFTIQNFPYYDIPDRSAMYLYGSLFYALYFCVSFPMFARLDETKNSWSMSRSFLDAAACCMIITQLLDAWRLFIGAVTDRPAATFTPVAVPFIF